MNNSLFIFKNIWLVDDDPADTTIFEDALSEILSDYTVKTFHSGRSMLRALERPPLPGLIFLDLKMPDIDGRNCLWQIRKKHSTRQLPVVVCSNSEYPRDVLLAYGLGANLYMIKPPTYDTTVQAIREVMLLDWSRPEHIADHFFVGNKYVPFRAQE